MLISRAKFDIQPTKDYNYFEESLAIGTATLSSKYFEYVEKAGLHTVKLAFYLLWIIVATNIPKPIIKDKASYTLIAPTSLWRKTGFARQCLLYHTTYFISNKHSKLNNSLSFRIGSCFYIILYLLNLKFFWKNSSLQKQKRTTFVVLNFQWSGMRDSNSRPLVPETSALPNCANPRSY